MAVEPEPPHGVPDAVGVEQACPMEQDATLDECCEIGSRDLCLTPLDNQLDSVDVVERNMAEKGSATYYVHSLERLAPTACNLIDKLHALENSPPALIAAESIPMRRPRATTCGTPPAEAELDEGVPEDRLSPAEMQMTLSLLSLVSTICQGDGAQKVGSEIGTEQQGTQMPKDLNDAAPLDQAQENKHQDRKKKQNIKMVRLGENEIETLYDSLYEEPYASQEKLYLCEFCLRSFTKFRRLCRHMAKCDPKHPPGDEIYRSPPPTGQNEGNSAVVDPSISVFEVNGTKQKMYCRSLCLLSKLFLDQKSLYYDVNPFLFYILCEKDEFGYHIVGYFSKEKASPEGCNLSCILTLPPYQGKGYGRFLIAFSYELSRIDGKVGTPERPLSDLGRLTYEKYWSCVLMEAIRQHSGSLSIQDLSDITYIRSDDIVNTLVSSGILRQWRRRYVIVVNSRVAEAHINYMANHQTIAIDRSRIHYVPYVEVSKEKRPRYTVAKF